jgi:tRNA(fMet)-specific endonuclease VapC
MRKILLDTNAYARFLGGDEHVLEALGGAGVVYMSIFVLGELHAGFLGGGKLQANKVILQKFLLKPTVQILNATSETAEFFGMVKEALKKAGTPIPINDVWIAAHAMETGSVMVTYDHHFTSVQGLRLWAFL